MKGTRLLVGVTHPLTAQILLRGQLSAFREAGMHVGLVAGSGPDLAKVRHNEKIETYQFPMERQMSPLSDFKALAAMSRAIRDFQPDIVNIGTPKAGLLGMSAAAWNRVPIRIYLLRGLPIETRSGATKTILRAAERLAIKCSHLVVCVSESLRRRVIEIGLADPGKLTVLGPGSSNGVDERRFRPFDAKEQELAQKRFAIPPGAPVIGFVGRLTRDKGIVDLADVFFDHILPRVPSARLLLSGIFEYGDPVPKEVRERLLEHPNVHTPGFVDDPELAYRAMDVLAFPSYREGFPNAPLEAAASSIPVAGYASTGTVDAVVDGSTGTLVDVGDKDSLGTAVKDYLENRKLCEKHGKSGRERAVFKFRRELVWERWISFYDDLLDQRAAKLD